MELSQKPRTSLAVVCNLWPQGGTWTKAPPVGILLRSGPEAAISWRNVVYLANCSVFRTSHAATISNFPESNCFTLPWFHNCQVDTSIEAKTEPPSWAAPFAGSGIKLRGANALALVAAAASAAENAFNSKSSLATRNTCREESDPKSKPSNILPTIESNAEPDNPVHPRSGKAILPAFTARAAQQQEVSAVSTCAQCSADDGSPTWIKYRTLERRPAAVMHACPNCKSGFHPGSCVIPLPARRHSAS
mmetsp:Transcript_4793/g.10307  ORF Transcript_4793/g.10307 Transcript_4793/m.10307 type:complete len:248 (+) Transcript_4793:423-1166(+)